MFLFCFPTGIFSPKTFQNSGEAQILYTPLFQRSSPRQRSVKRPSKHELERLRSKSFGRPDHSRNKSRHARTCCRRRHAGARVIGGRLGGTKKNQEGGTAVSQYKLRPQGENVERSARRKLKTAPPRGTEKSKNARQKTRQAQHKTTSEQFITRYKCPLVEQKM